MTSYQNVVTVGALAIAAFATFKALPLSWNIDPDQDIVTALYVHGGSYSYFEKIEKICIWRSGSNVEPLFKKLFSPAEVAGVFSGCQADLLQCCGFDDVSVPEVLIVIKRPGRLNCRSVPLVTQNLAEKTTCVEPKDVDRLFRRDW